MQTDAKNIRATSPPERRGFTIDEWCAAWRICRATFYNMKKCGTAPRTIKIGARVIITVNADEEWQRERERKTQPVDPHVHVARRR